MYEDVYIAKKWWSDLSLTTKKEYYESIYDCNLVSGELALISNLQKIRLYKLFGK